MATKSILLDYQSTKDVSTGLDFGTRNGTVSMQQPQYLDAEKKKLFRVIRVMVSPEMPNVYKYGGVDTTSLKLTADGGATWVTLALKTGIYTIAMLQDAINDVGTQASWWKTAGDFGYTLGYNPATQIVYVTMDSSKLGGLFTQLGINFNVGNMADMLGFSSSNSSFVTDGLHTANLPPQMDYQGQYVELFCSIIQGCRWINGKLSSSICRIPITQSQSEIIYPSGNSGFISPVVHASIPAFIQSFDIKLINQRGNDAVFMYGGLTVELEILDG